MVAAAAVVGGRWSYSTGGVGGGDGAGRGRRGDGGAALRTVGKWWCWCVAGGLLPSS